SLGLPDTIIGVAIPDLQREFGIPLAFGGLLSMIVICGTVISSFLSDRIIKTFGTGKIVFISCLITGLSLLGFSLSPSFYWLLLLALPLGLGGGTVDVALNSYVAHHFRAHHMNWLHSFWGVGATLGPVIMSFHLMHSSWRSGFGTIAIVQLSFALVLLLSLSLWKKHKEIKHDTHPVQGNIFRIPAIPYALTTMLIYCAVEIGTGLWGSSYLIAVKGFEIDTAAKYIALYYLGITTGRFLSGFISFKLNNTQLIRLGILLALCGSAILWIATSMLIVGAGVVIIGLGLAPIFPSMIHETPNRFGKNASQRIIGYQMGFAYMGSAIVPPALGVFYQHLGLTLFPVALLALLLILLVITEKLNRLTTCR
ncbi:MAG: MFS transporter, partial [Bacteroidetes bacterium]